MGFVFIQCITGETDRQTPAAKYLYWSIFKQSRHLGFGVFIDIWSTPQIICRLQNKQHLVLKKFNIYMEIGPDLLAVFMELLYRVFNII
jgi:hypothetical protein